MDVNYTASWRVREDRVDFTLSANISQQWLSVGFTDKRMMVSTDLFNFTLIPITFFRNLILLLEPLITMGPTL